MIVHGLPRIMKNTPYLLGRMDTLCLGNMLHTRMASLPCGALAYVVLTSQGPIVLGSGEGGALARWRGSALTLAMVAEMRRGRRELFLGRRGGDLHALPFAR